MFNKQVRLMYHRNKQIAAANLPHDGDLITWKLAVILGRFAVNTPNIVQQDSPRQLHFWHTVCELFMEQPSCTTAQYT